MNQRGEARLALHRVAVHIVARARTQACGRFSLRVTPSGFGTPDMGENGRRVRVSGNQLVVESDVAGAAAALSMPINGSTLAALAEFAGLDLSKPLDVGHDTPSLGDVDARIDLDPVGAEATSRSHGLIAAILDQVLAGLLATATPTLPRLWPEHFDVAIEAQAHPERRVNLGGSPGDGFSEEPYLYVAPWTADRPGNPGFWNVPFGAARALNQAGDAPTAIMASGVGFLLDGYRRLV